MQALEDLVGETAYILGHTIDQSMDRQGTLVPFKNIKELETYFKTMPSASLGEPTLLHGILTRATSLPKSVAADVDIVLVMPFATNEHDSYIKKFADFAELMRFIELVVTDDGSGYDDDENIPGDIVEELMDLDPQNIEDIYIFYGYEIELHYTFDKESTDDSIVTAAKKAFGTVEGTQ